MSRRAEIKELAWAVHAALTVYIATHNAIFREAATFRSLLKNLVGRGVPMAKLLEDSERLLPLWDAIHDWILDFRQSSYSSLPEGERRYVEILSRYVTAVRETVTALVERQRLWKQGSMGRRRNPMTWEAFREKERHYEELVREYMEIGQELNDASPIIFE